MIDHSLLPSITKASFPAKYEAAKLALQEANSIDECKAWADKTAALASYAKQSKDDELMKTAMRIRDRAIRRCGELLKEFEKSQGGRPKAKTTGGTSDSFSPYKKAWKMAGLSEDQAQDALSVANVPLDLFEEQVESDDPPTVAKLAEQGKNSVSGQPFYEKLGLTKEQFQAAIHFKGSIRRHIETLSQYKVKDVAGGLNKKERAEVLAQLKTVEEYHEKLKDRL